MTQPTRQRATNQQNNEHNDWGASPVAAGIVAFVWALLLPLLFRWVDQWIAIPPWITFLPHVILGVVAVITGMARKPRALSGVSMLYRLSATFAAGAWVFLTTADHTGGGDSGAIFAGAGQLALLGALGVIGYLAVRTKSLKYPAIFAVGTFIVGEGVILALSGGEWGFGNLFGFLGRLLTETAPIDRAGLIHFLIPGGVTFAATFAAAFAWLGHHFANHELEEDEKLNLGRMLETNSREKEAMRAMLAGLTGEKLIRPTDFKQWDNSAGETYEVDLSQTRLGGWRALITHCDTLATKMRLPEGCGVEASKGSARHLALLHVARQNKLKDIHNYPNKLVLGNIYEGRLAGVLRPGDPILVELRQNSMVVIGQKRSGKTTFLQDLIASLLQTRDTLVWTIDLNGGGLPLPFLFPFADGRTARPAVDWAADNVPEALRMVNTALAIAEDRKRYYKFRKKKAGITLLPIDHDVPQIVLMIDEGAEVMGAATDDDAREVCEIIEKLQRIAGDSGVNVVYSVLRATADHLNPAVKNGCAIRVAMRVSDRAELAYLFGNYTADPDDAPYQGSGHIQAGHGEPARVFKAFYLEPAQMEDIAVETAIWRPFLDAQGRQVGGRTYRERWVRNRHMLENEYGELQIDPSVLENPDRMAPPDQGRPPARAGATAQANGPAAEDTAGGVGTMVAERPAQPTGGRPQRSKPAAGDVAARIAANEALMKRLTEGPAGGGGGDGLGDLADQIDQAFGEAFPEGVPSFDGAGHDGAVPPPAAPPAPAGPSGPPPPGEVPVQGQQPAAAQDTTDDSPAVAASAEQAVRKLLLREGPLGFQEIVNRTGFSGTTINKVLRRAADYLVDRAEGQPYDHRDRKRNDTP